MHTCQLSWFSRESPSFSWNLQICQELPTMALLHFLFVNFVGNVLFCIEKSEIQKKGLTINMAPTLKIFGFVSRFLYSGGWQVCKCYSAQLETWNQIHKNAKWKWKHVTGILFAQKYHHPFRLCSNNKSLLSTSNCWAKIVTLPFLQCLPKRCL